MIDLNPIILSLELAAITTIILFIISIPLANWLAHTGSRLKPVIETIVSMPLVLPPTVIGFYLLVAFSPNQGLGKFLNDFFGVSLAFSFEGLIIASIIYSLPFMVQPIQAGLTNLPPYLTSAGKSLGKSNREILLRILLPNIKASLLSGIILTFAHTIGEFGVVLMIGGNIPGETRVASIAIYDQVEALNYQNANLYSIILFAITFSIILIVYSINRKTSGSLWK